MNKQIESDNPFSAPQSDGPVPVGEGKTAQTSTGLGQIAKRVFLDWEKMRLAYIGILVAFTLLIGWSQLGNLDFWVVALMGGVVANMCYFLGPIVDTYVTWLGFRSVALRWMMFIVGTVFTMAGAAAVVVSLAQWKQ